MAAPDMMCIFLLIVLSFFHRIKATRVEVSVPIFPVTVGGILPIQCQIQDMESNHIVKMFRVINGQTEELTNDIRYDSLTLGQRYFVTKRTMTMMTGTNMVYFMTIIDVSTFDEGEYVCKVYELFEADYIKIAEGSTNVEIYYLPNSIYPQCHSTPVITDDLDEGVELTLKCISAKGSPTVALRWIDNSNQELFSLSKTRDDTVTAELKVRSSNTLHGTVFICEMTSPGFQDMLRSCRIGPMTIKQSTRNDNTPLLVSPSAPTQATQRKEFTSNDCNRNCPENDKYKILYLSVATAGAGILCIVFLITTIIMCYKYQIISTATRGTQRRHISTGDGSEPVYVSLQKRVESATYDIGALYGEKERKSLCEESDRNSTYMSVEDPNNPGSKVLMPKEVFEELYNSLTLKRV